ncbi:hypothetical protein NVV43_27345, partial [Escherichia marmotae]|nr:hypothetical protein [Escherichia marmotae]
RAETGLHGPLGGRRTEQRLGVRKITRRTPDVLADQRDRSIELVVDLGLREPIEQSVPVRVRPDVDPARRSHVAERRPRQRCAVVRK